MIGTVIRIECGDGKRPIRIIDYHGLPHLNTDKQRLVKLGIVLEKQGPGEKGGVDREREVGADPRRVVFVGMS